MNKTRRKEIDEVLGLLAEAREQLETIRDAEQEYYDTMPESIQTGVKGDTAQAAIDALEDALASLEEVEVACGSAQE